MSTCPERSRDGEGALVYLSLGSLGSADVELMQRLVDVLRRHAHRYIVSKGPRADEFELADNMWGARVPAPDERSCPLVDLVITHGGNNTTTEAFHFGKPMIVLPLFWDQYDNAQRVDELGFGVRLDTYAFEDDELQGGVERCSATPPCASAPRPADADAFRGEVAAAADVIERRRRAERV